MKRQDEGKPSLVEFLGSIKFPREQDSANQTDAAEEPFARRQPRTRRKRLKDESHLIRSPT